MHSLSIYRVGGAPAIRFAAAELKKYLTLATGADIRVRTRSAYDQDTEGLWVGTSAHLGRGSSHSDDDAIDIWVGKAGGVVTGSNPRSTLLAAYRYLTQLGFRWVRPGRDGRFVPRLDRPLAKRVVVKERASYGHRVVCIEGASGWQHVRDMIDWMPKLGFNGYFVQFRSSFTFFDRWYRHEMNPLLKKQPFTQADAQRYTQQIWAECAKRGLKIQMVGHGWTCEPFGIAGLGWDQHKGNVPAKAKPHLAKVNGKRDLWGGVALNTNLCYGNVRTRKIMVDAVADYAAKHPQVDAIHLWLADGYNNHCECPRCRDHRPADLYVKLLNEVDAELTKRDLPTRIVFLIYVDLLWPPVAQRIVNQSRFILMFAPITRTYSDPLRPIGSKSTKRLPRFERNKLTMPRSVEQNIAFLRAWQRIFNGDSFDFDYHLMWDHYKDPGHYELAKVLHADIQALRDLGLNGLNSCQVQRCFLPTGLLMTVMGRTLWDRNVGFNQMANDHYKAAFGQDGQKVKRYTQRLSQLFDPPFLRGERSEAEKQETAKKLAKVAVLIQSFMPVIAANQSLENQCHRRSWYYLKQHARLCLAMAPALELTIHGEKEAARSAVCQVIALARRLESRIHHVFDVHFLFVTICLQLGWTAEELDLS